MSRLTRLMAAYLVLVTGTFLIEAKWRQQRPAADGVDLPPPEQGGEDIPHVPFLVEMIGKEMYSMVDRPKYKFVLYITVGPLPEQESFVVALNMICNFLYTLIILLGFLFLPRGFMLIGTLATLFVGPALVLVLLGTAAVVAVAFVLYPITSAVSIWTFFFLTSKLFQVIGRKMGLDHDGDGDVDFLDVLHYVAQTRWGRLMGLPKLHDILNKAAMGPFQEINRKLDAIHKSTRALEVNGSIGSGSRHSKAD